MSHWDDVIVAIKDALQDWEMYHADPESEVMPVVPIPELPSSRAPAEKAAEVGALLDRVWTLQAHLDEMRNAAGDELEQVRRVRTAAETYRA